MQLFTAMQYLMIDIANSFGLDGKNWDVRLQWFADNENKLEDLVKQSKEPAQFYAGTLAYRAAQRGEPIGYLCGADATASGLQILSALAGCEQSAMQCNLVNTGKREDAYTNVHEFNCALLGVHPDQFLVPRKDAKKAVMTHFYGSKALPREVYGEGSKALDAFYHAVDTLMPGANMLNYDLLSLWNPNAYAHHWTLPDGFDVHIKVMDTITHQVSFNGQVYDVEQQVNQPKEEGLSMGANIVHSIDGMVVREMNRRCNYDILRVNQIADIMELGSTACGMSTIRQKDLALLRLLALYDVSGFMSAVVFEHLDGQNAGHLDQNQANAVEALLKSLPGLNFQLICIHDCFKFHANYGNDVRRQYANILAEIAESTILDAIVTELTGKPMKIKKLSTTLGDKIRESEYAIC